MTCLDRLLRIFVRSKTPSADALAATLIADASHGQAQDEAQAIRAGLAESDAIAAGLRLHNANNRYGEWLRRVIAP